MKRRGRKSAAQTPAPKSERIYGSKKNPKGSASSEKSAKQIKLSEKTINGLENKLAEFRKSHTNKKITLNDLKAVYRRGLGAYSSSHRPTITGGFPNTRNAWAMARVNKFLLKAGGTKVKAAYVQDDDLMKYEDGGLVKSGVKVYHGSTRQFEKFDKSKLGEATKSKSAKSGFFFTDDIKTAKSYSRAENWRIVQELLDKGKIKEAEDLENLIFDDKDPSYLYEKRLFFKNPLIIDAKGQMYNDFSDEINISIENAKENGNDVLIIKNLSDNADYSEYTPATHFLVFDESIIQDKYEDGGLIAPNGKKSNLTAEQYKLVRTPEFKAWFGDWENDPENSSKVVDENGEPLVLVRGNLINQEELGYTFNLGQNFLKKESGNTFGFFFTNNIDIAKKYMLVDHFDEVRGGSITNVFIKSNKILDLKDFDLKIGQDSFVQGLIQKGISFDNEYNYLEKTILDFDSDTYKYWGNNVFDYFDAFPELRNLFIKNGFSSVIFYEMSRNYSKYKVYVAFESNQIKLADGSNTTFDSNNPDIRYAKGGKTNNMKKKGIEARGDCYYIAGQFAMDNIFTPEKIDYIGTPYLVHAEVQGQGAISHIRYGHAWIEDDENVYDFSNGRELVIPKIVYYAIGDVVADDPKKYQKYTFEQARRKMVDTGTYGCWDLDVEYREGGDVYAESMKRYDKGGKIASVRMTEMPQNIGDDMPKIYVILDNKNEEEFLFDYYPDEISFTEKELIGLTPDEARHLKFEKDKNYLMYSNTSADFKKGGKVWNDEELLKRYKRGESIGFSGIAHLKAQGLIKRADGTKRKSAEFGAEILPKEMFTPAEKDFFDMYDIQATLKAQQRNFEDGGNTENIKVILVPESYQKMKTDLLSLNNNGNPRIAMLDSEDMVIGGVFVNEDKEECTFDICVTDENRYKGYSNLLINALIKDFHENMDTEMLVCENDFAQKLGWENGCFTQQNAKDFMKTNRYKYNNYLHTDAPMIMDEFKSSNGDVKCVGCGWQWNIAQSDESDKYVCHQCGFDNTLFYDSNIMSKLKKPMSVPEISYKHNVDEEYVLEQLKKGMEHEMEHTDDEQLAEIIALHHIAERPDYYQVIEEMKLGKGGDLAVMEQESMEYDIPEYIQNERDFAQKVMDSDETRISKAMICKAKISMATDNQKAVENSEEKDAWSEVCNIWKDCFYEVLSGDVVEYQEKECGCGCETTTYDKGGLAYGNSHDKGGIPLKVESTGQDIEIEGGEGVINKRSMQMTKQLEFQGKQMTPCEIISKINEMGGGVKFKCADVKKIVAEDGNF